jgi:hypothetical protein
VIRGRTSGLIIAPRKEANGDFTEVYGLVTVLNTRETGHGRLGMIVFSGNHLSGNTWSRGVLLIAAMPQKLAIDLRARGLGRVSGGLPFSNALLVSYEYHTHRVITKD